MAPFKFGKKSKDKNKSSPNKMTSTPPKEHHLPTPPPFLHMQTNSNTKDNINNNNNSSNILPHDSSNVQNIQDNYVPTIPSRPPHQQHQSFQNFSNTQANSRVYPTPTPASQRNVSGATTQLINTQFSDNQLPANSTAVTSRERTVWNRIKLANSPFPRYRHVASAYCTDDNKVYVIGGLHDQSVYGDTWIIKADDDGTNFNSMTVDISDNTPPPRVGHAATLCGNAFVVFGGDTHKVNKDGLMDDDIYLFNINSYKWTIPQPVGQRPLGRYGHKISIIATTQMKTKLYLFGGQFDETYFNDLAVFDLSSFRRPDSHWEFLKPKTFVPPPLTNHSMVSYDNKLWVFGGDTLQGLVNQVFMYDPIINDWSVVDTTPQKNDPENSPPPLQEHAAIIYKDLMVVVGGKDEQDNYLNSVYFLNLKSFQWFKLPDFRPGIPQGRSGHSVTLLKNSKLLIMGGDKFDYARLDDNDLHTSETNMGRGTILYTLDLSGIEDICPGIMDATSPISEENKISSNKLDYPETPKVNTFNQPSNDPQNNVPHQTPIQTGEDSFRGNFGENSQNILTPYAGPETQKTPKTESTEQQNDQSSYGTSVTPNLTHNTQASMAAAVSNLLSDGDTTLESDAKISQVNDSSKSPKIDTLGDPIEVRKSVSRDTEKATQSPISKLPALNVTNSPEKNTEESELPSAKETTSANVISSPTEKSAQETTHSIANVSSPQRSEIVNNKSASVSTAPAIVTTEDVSQVSNPNVSIASINGDMVSRKVIEELKNELINIKNIANEKASQASERIKELENELSISKAEHSNSSEENHIKHTKLQNRYDILETDNSAMKDHVTRLEALLNDKFLNVERANDIIKSQKSTIEKLTNDYELLKKENEELKSEAAVHNNELSDNIKDYTVSMDTLIGKWREYQTMVQGSPNDHDSPNGIPDEEEEPDHKEERRNNHKNREYTGINPHHRNVVNNLSSQLDDLLTKSHDLSKSKNKLSADYQALESRHRSLSQDLLIKQTKLDEISSHYKDSLDSINNTNKELEESQHELENVKKLNKKLQEELERLKSNFQS